jgi:hypothetical protein
MALLWEAQ